MKHLYFCRVSIRCFYSISDSFKHLKVCCFTKLIIYLYLRWRVVLAVTFTCAFENSLLAYSSLSIIINCHFCNVLTWAWVSFKRNLNDHFFSAIFRAKQKLLCVIKVIQQHFNIISQYFTTFHHRRLLVLDKTSVNRPTASGSTLPSALKLLYLNSNRHCCQVKQKCDDLKKEH